MKHILLFSITFSLLGHATAQNVGIGTTTPQAKLHVVGDVKFLQNGYNFDWSGESKSIRVGTNSTGHTVGEGSFAMGSSASAEGQYSFSFGPFSHASGVNSFSFGGTSSAIGISAVNFGVMNQAGGRSSLTLGSYAITEGEHSHALGYEVLTKGNFSTALGEYLTAQASNSLVLGKYNVIEGNTEDWVATDPAIVYGNGTETTPSNAFTLYKNGDLTIAGSLSVASDARLKKDITPLSSALSKITALKGYNYRWKNEEKMGSALQVGLLAQEIQTTIPELVTETANKELSVNYNGMTPYLIEAIKELNDSLKELNEAVKQLKAENELLKAKLK